MSTAAVGNGAPSSSRPSPPPLRLPPHLLAYLSCPAVTTFLASLAPHFPSYSNGELSSVFATLLAARYRHSPSCTSQLQWTQKYAPTSVNELWSHGPQTATLRQYTHSFTAATPSASPPSLLLVGPSSSSKTAAAYAIASTLQSAVIEVHPGMARSGRDVQALCGEATQSHRLHGERKDVWAVVNEERWRSWEKSHANKKEEQREPEDAENNEQTPLSAKRTQHSKRATKQPNSRQQPRRRRKQRQSESEHSEVDVHSEIELPDRLVIRLKLRSNNRARLLSCPVVPSSTLQAEPEVAGRRKGQKVEQKGVSIASFFTHSTVGKQARGSAVQDEQAADEDEVVIERTETVTADSGSARKRKAGWGKKGKPKPKGIGDFFTTAPPVSQQLEQEETKEAPHSHQSPEQDTEEVAEERRKRSRGKERRKSKREAVSIGSFFAAPVTAKQTERDGIEEETKEEPAVGTRKRSDDWGQIEEDATIQEEEEEEESKMLLTVIEVMKGEERSDREERDDSKPKVQKGIGSFFGGKSEVIVLSDTGTGKRRGRKSKQSAAAIDLTSPPPTARSSSPTPPSPLRPPSPPPTATASACAVQPSSSLILFEDVDLVFPSDTHFHRTLRSLVLTAKRPLLLTAQCVPSWVDEVSDDRLRIVQMARMGNEECVLHAILICAVETGVDASDAGDRGWNCVDVARLCCWWQYDLRRVLMTLQMLVSIRDTHAYSAEAPVDEALLPSVAATSLLSSPPTITSASSLLLSVVGLSCVAPSLISTFSTLCPTTFALLCSSSSSVDITHLNWLSSVQRRAADVMQRLPLSEAQVTASVEEMISVADLPAECIRVINENKNDDANADVSKTIAAEATETVAQASTSIGAAEVMHENKQETAHSVDNLSQQEDEAELGSSRRVNGKRIVIAEDDEEYVHDVSMQSDNNRLDSDVILVEPPSPLMESKQQKAAFMLHVRQLACQQLKERERQQRLAYAASSTPSLAQQLACRFLRSVSSLSSLLADCNILSCVRLLPLSSSVPSSLFHLRHPSLPPQYIDVNVPYSGTSYRCADWWLTGERDGLRGEMEEERRDEQPICEEMFDELRAEMEAMGLSEMCRAVKLLETEMDGKSAAELNHRQQGTIPSPRRTPLGRQSGLIEVVVAADIVPDSFDPSTITISQSQPSELTVAAMDVANIASMPLWTHPTNNPLALELGPSRTPTMSSPAARISTIHASRALFSSLRCKLHAPSSRTWLTDIYPFLCQMAVVEGHREDERRAQERTVRQERDRGALERRVRRQAERETRQLKRRDKKRARKEKRKRKRQQHHLDSTKSCSDSSHSSDSSSDDSSSSHTSGSSGAEDSGVDSAGSECVIDDFFAPRTARRSRRRHLSSRRVAVEESETREELHVCGGLNDELYEEVMAALRLPRWREWTDE